MSLIQNGFGDCRERGVFEMRVADFLYCKGLSGRTEVILQEVDKTSNRKQKRLLLQSLVDSPLYPQTRMGEEKLDKAIRYCLGLPQR